MARSRAERPTFMFNKGLNTDAPILVFPQDFTTDEINFELMLDGTRRKRRGLTADGESSEINVPVSEGFAVRTFKWRSVNTNPDLNFHVWQIGYTLVFADDTTTPTDNLRAFTVDLRAFAVADHDSDEEIGNNYIDMAFGRGHAIIVGKYVEPTLLVYNEDDDDLEALKIQILERDFQGIEDGIDNTTRPAVISDSYAYNLVNQGWVYGDVLTFQADKGNYPSKNMIPWLGFRREIIEGFNPDDGTKVFSPDKLVAELFQDAPSPKGHFIQNPFDTTVNLTVNTETIKNYVGGGWAEGTDDGFLPDSPNSLNLPYPGNTPTQSLVTATFQNPHFLQPGDTFELYTQNLGKIGSNTGDGNRWWGIGGGANNEDPTHIVESVLDSRTVTFYITMADDHAGWRNNWPHSYWPNVYSFAGGTTLSIEGRIIDERPTAVAFFAGRAWYAGVPNPILGSALFFSQVVEVDSQYGKCYQVADPTDENISDLLPTDGGVLRIPEMGRVLRLLPYSNFLLVFASNGVWQIGPGESGYFTANSYSIRKLTDIGCESARSVVLAEEIPCFWGRSGIIAIIEDTNSGFLIARSLSKDKIDNFYKAISAADRKEASGDWDEVNKRVVWTYNELNDEEVREYKALYFDVKFGAFTPHKFGVTVHDIFTTTDGVRNEETALRYIVSTVEGATQIAKTTSLTFADFDSDPYDAYMVTGYDTAQSPTRRKHAPIITVFSKRTEIVTNDVEPEPPNEFGRFLFSVTSDSPYINAINLEDMTNYAAPGTPPSSVCNGIAISPDSTTLVVVMSNSPYITRYETATWTTPTPSASPAPSASGRGVAYNHDGSKLAVVFDTSPFVYVYDTSTWSGTSPSTLPNSSGTHCAYSDDGAYLAVTSDASPYLHVYNTSDMSVVSLSGTLPNTARVCAWSKDGAYLAVGHSSSPYISVFETTTWTKVSIPSVPQAFVQAAAFSPDGNYLAIGAVMGFFDDPDGLHIYNVADWSKVSITTSGYSFAATSGPTEIIFSDDSNYLCIGSNIGLCLIRTEDWSEESVEIVNEVDGAWRGITFGDLNI